MATLEELIVSLPYPEDPRISPDGSTVAYVATPYGRVEHAEGDIWLAPTDSGEAHRFTSGAGRDEQPRWSPDSQSLAFLSERAEPGRRALYRMRRDGGEAELLVERKRSIERFAWSPDGGTIAFLAPDDPDEEDERRERERDDAQVYGERWPLNRLHLLDVAGQTTRTLPTGEMHVSEIAWSPDGSRIAYIARPTPELEANTSSRLFVISVTEAAEPREIAIDGGWTPHDLTWSADGTTLLFVGGHDPQPQGSFTIYAMPSDGSAPAHPVDPDIDAEQCVRSLHVVPGSERVAVTIAHGLTTRIEWLDPASGEFEPLYGYLNGDLRAANLFMHNGRPLLAVVRTSGSEPPELFVGQPGDLRQISNHHAPLREFAFGAQEPFSWQAPDGLELDGVLIQPANESSGPHPTVVLVHGGPYGRSSNEWNLAPLRWGQWLAHHGYAVLLPNYRGGVGHGHWFATQARGNVGVGDFPDVLSMVDAAIERGIADPERLGIGGWSQGGFMTAWAVGHTTRFKAAVMGAGVSDWNMMTLTSDLPTFESVLGGSRPWDGVAANRAPEVSPIFFAGQAETPLLMLHGQNDERVPVSQAIGFGRALRERNVPVQLVTYPREPHGVRERAHQRDILRRVLAWYQQWLGEA
jgi:dipeptidyl aminopeptidase/acylaminoacyl peptidase